MTGKRILIFPNSNTLSHVSRALAIYSWLETAGYEVHIGVSNTRRSWTQRFCKRCHGILELWEPSGKPFPNPGWFSDSAYAEACISSQEAVINRLHPDLIIGIFDFISGISHGSIPLFTVNGACMLPWYRGVLGFDETETEGREEQKKILRTFWAFAARSFGPSLEKRRISIPASALSLLVGDVNSIYEVPEITGIFSLPSSHYYIGPILWDGWDTVGEKVKWSNGDKRSTVYLNSGTLMKNEQTMAAIINQCLVRGLRLLMSSGDNGPSWSTDRIFCRPFLAPSDVLKRSDLVVCTGGVGGCYMNLCHGVPSLVIPMQPEQATNGINIARHRCGEIYRHNIVFLGDADRYQAPFDHERFGFLLDSMLCSPETYGKCRHLQRHLAKMDTREKLLSLVGNML